MTVVVSSNTKKNQKTPNKQQKKHQNKNPINQKPLLQTTRQGGVLPSDWDEQSSHKAHGCTHSLTGGAEKEQGHGHVEVVSTWKKPSTGPGVNLENKTFVTHWRGHSLKL